MKGATISNAAKAISHADFGWGGSDLSDASLRKATITARTGGVMYTMDGTDPTATLGHLIPVNTTVVIEGTPNNISRLKFIREAGTDAALTISLER
jgi:hypothetical protein